MVLRHRLSSSLLSLSVASLLSACASSSPENFIEKTFELQCEYIQDCDADEWERSGYDSVKDCRDDLLALDVDGQSFMDAFVEECTDFDRSAARKCLKATRDYVKECKQTLSEADQEQCSDVCGTEMDMMTESDDGSEALMVDPDHTRFIMRALEHLERTGQLDLDEPAEQLASEP